MLKLQTGSGRAEMVGCLLPLDMGTGSQTDNLVITLLLFRQEMNSYRKITEHCDLNYLMPRTE